MSRPRPAATAKPSAPAPVASPARRLDRPVGRLGVAGVALLILLAAYGLVADGYGREVWPRGENLAVKGLWLVSDPFASFRLWGDDLPTMAGSRTRDALATHLLDGGAAPLFRAWAHGLATLAGDLARLPRVLAWASFGTLAAVMLVGGQVVAREVGNRAVGLAAMAGIGVTTVMEPAATGFAGGQALGAGLCALAMLAALRRWRVADGVTWLVVASLASLAAPLFWAGGLAVGPAGAAYLLAEPRRSLHRRAALVPLLATGAAAALLLTLGVLGGSPVGLSSWPRRAASGLMQTFQAIPEALVLNNLGLDTALTTVQGIVLVAGLGVLWRWSRECLRATPIEAAGATLTVLSYLVALTLRGDSDLARSSETGWYHAMPHLGAVLFAAGWWSAVHGGALDRLRSVRSTDPRGSPVPPPTTVRPASRQGALAALVLTVALLVLHAPRAQRLFLDSVPPMTEAETKRFPIPELQRLRGIYLASEESARQRRALARLDRIEGVARRSGISAEAIRRAFDPFELPGWPGWVAEPDPIDLLDLPPSTAAADPAALQVALGALMVPEPPERPEWLPPEAPWPPESDD